MKKISLLLLLFSLSACVTNIADINVDAAPQDTAYLVLDNDITFDGTPHMFCDMARTINMDEPGLERAAFESDPHIKIMRVIHPGKYSLTSISCMSYKVLWNKIRVQDIHPPLTVDVQPGTITYPGTIVGDWDSEGMALKDLLNGGGTLTKDEGSLVLKREDRSTEIKSLLTRENPKWLEKFKFVTKKFEEGSGIIQ